MQTSLFSNVGSKRKISCQQISVKSTKVQSPTLCSESHSTRPILTWKEEKRFQIGVTIDMCVIWRPLVFFVVGGGVFVFILVKFHVAASFWSMPIDLFCLKTLRLLMCRIRSAWPHDRLKPNYGNAQLKQSGGWKHLRAVHCGLWERREPDEPFRTPLRGDTVDGSRGARTNCGPAHGKSGAVLWLAPTAERVCVCVCVSVSAGWMERERPTVPPSGSMHELSHSLAGNAV